MMTSVGHAKILDIELNCYTRLLSEIVSIKININNVVNVKNDIEEF